MASQDTSEEYRSGYVGLIGRPNVGKSTLLNAILGQSITPVSPRPQTTRHNQLGILSLPYAQVIFVDTPGLHKPHNKLGEWMNQSALEVLEDVDTIVVIFDVSQPPNEEDYQVAEAIKALNGSLPVIVALNKVDELSKDKISHHFSAYEGLLPEAEFLTISATRGDQREALVDKIIDTLPPGPPYFDDDIITDATEREIAADLIRTACLELLREEVPYSIAVRIDDYKERGESGAFIAATLFVERESQKGIVIGKGGNMLKKIGTSARKKIENAVGRKVYLELRVKVLPKWRNDTTQLRRFGYGR